MIRYMSYFFYIIYL